MDDAKFELLVDEYYKRKILRDNLDYELSNINKQIKETLIAAKRKRVNVGKYFIELEEKYTVSKEFISLLKSKSLSGLITESCSISDFKRACRMLNISPESQFKYLIKKPNLWLYVKLKGK